MARQDINTEFNTFVGGILTEANPINYPKGFTLDEENFLLERNGTRRRRQGLSKKTSTLADGTKAFTDFYLWRNAVQLTGEDILVTWTQEATLGNNRLKFFLLDDETDPFSNLITTINLTAKITSVVAHYSYLVVNQLNQPTTVNYPQTGSTSNEPITFHQVYEAPTNVAVTATETALRMNVRDFPGLDSSSFTERAATLSEERQYNLLNSGWTTTNINQFDTDIGDFPSLRDNMNTGLDAETGVFTSTWVNLANNGKGTIPAGREVVDYFYPNNSRITFMETETGNATGFAFTQNGGSVVASASFAGRLFYLMDSPGNEFGATSLAFSQVVTTADSVTNCFQAFDPTARDESILLDSDGGILDMSLIGTPIDMLVLNTRMVVFGTNGVFEVFSTGNVFTPASVGVRKVSDVELTGQPVLAEDVIYFFANGGIYSMVYNPSSEEFNAINISESTIQTIVNDIPLADKKNIKGVYVPTDKTVRFIFDETGFVGKQELVYDVPLKAWYKNKITFTTVDTTLQDLLYIGSFTDTNTTYPVDSRLYYIVKDFDVFLSTYFIGNYSDTTFKDFTGVPEGGNETQAFMETGYINAGDSQRRKQANYIVPSFIRTEDGFTDDGSGNLTPTNESSCNIQARWDYADTDGGNLFGASFEAYRILRLYIPSGPADTFDYGQKVITTKNKLLGRGRALTIRFSTSAGKDCRLLGWGLGFESNTKV